MRWVSCALALSIAVAGCSGSQRAAPRTRMSTKEIVDKNKPAIVRITSQIGGTVGVGTGFVVGADGRIATNLHVIAGAAAVRVKLLDGSEYPVTRVVAADERRDLAIIAIEKTGLPVLRIGNSDELSAGDRVIAIGNPLGYLDYTVSDGLISSIRQLDAQTNLLQISAPISQGSSGGPLFNPYGEVIGVAVGIVDPKTGGQNLNFGVPSNYLKPLIAFRGAGEDVETFSQRYQDRRPPAATTTNCPNKPGKIDRNVPIHDLGVLDGCSPEQVAGVFTAIQKAIEVGAPVYNRCEFEACFVIYRAVAEKYGKDKQMCRGIRDAFGVGLRRAEGTSDFALKAWAMRDTFDGLLEVIARKVGAAP